MSFRYVTPFPGIYHITDCMGVSMTLIEGKKEALLIDTGYGLENLRDFLNTLTNKPVTVLLSHGHHDHILGAAWFEKTYMFPEDRDEFSLRTGTEQREKVAEQARAKGLEVKDDFFRRTIPLPDALEEKTMNLGDLEVWIRRVPGHTPGSLVVYIPEYRLLLSCDDWNPCTWIWFPSALGVAAWKRNMDEIMELPFNHVLCSHQSELLPRKELERFMAGITEESIRNAKRIPLGGTIDTREIEPEEGMVLVFDYQKVYE